jgi:predicted amidohydrolase
VPSNAQAHASLIRSARARLIVFPEMSLTGYELDAEPVSPEDQALMPIVEACADANSVALVGAPVADIDGRRPHIGTLRIGPNGIAVAYRKCYLGGEEPVRFAPGDVPVAFELDGWRIGLGICKDTGVEQHILATAGLNVDLYAAGLVHLPSELEMQENRAIRITRACAAYAAFASFAGPTGGFDRTAGGSSIWSTHGTGITRAGSQPGELARATLTSPVRDAKPV